MAERQAKAPRPTALIVGMQPPLTRAITLLYLLIRRGEAYRVSTLFFLVPATTAGLGYFAFGERLTAVALVGMVLVAGGASLVNLTGAAVGRRGG